MTIGTMDIFLLVIIVASLVIGFFWGAVRSLMLFAAWFVAFFAGAYLQVQLGAYLTRQWDNYPAAFDQMAAFGIIYVFLLLAAPFFVFSVTRADQRVTRYQVLDDLVGALFAVAVAVLGIAGVLIVLATYYGPGPVIAPLPGPEWTRSFYEALLASTIGGNINDIVVPIIGFILGPFLPSVVSDVFA
jgi:uncharacterized membrane protein required for colicin V production